MCVCIVWPITDAGVVLRNTCPILRTDMKTQSAGFFPTILQTPSDVDVNKSWGKQIGSSVFIVPALMCIITFKPIKHQSGASSLTAVYANVFVCAAKLQRCYGN